MNKEIVLPRMTVTIGVVSGVVSHSVRAGSIIEQGTVANQIDRAPSEHRQIDPLRGIKA